MMIKQIEATCSLINAEFCCAYIICIVLRNTLKLSGWVRLTASDDVTLRILGAKV